MIYLHGHSSFAVFIVSEESLIVECTKKESPVCQLKGKPGYKIKAIGHLGFNCKDLEKSIAFYRDIIGCTEKFYMNYGDLADAVEREAAAEGKKMPLYAKAMRRFAEKKWSVYFRYFSVMFAKC